MKGCPLLKSILVRTASWSLYFFSSIPVKDASNGFRLFSNNLYSKVMRHFSVVSYIICDVFQKYIVNL